MVIELTSEGHTLFVSAEVGQVILGLMNHIELEFPERQNRDLLFRDIFDPKGVENISYIQRE